MTPCEFLGNSARYLDALADTTPSGILGTPFGVVCDALRVVAASVWDADPSVYRAGIAWAWYLGARPSALSVDGLRALLCAALVSECAPLVRESQTVDELVALLSLWMDYRPVFADMEALFATYGVRVDVRAISDPEGQVLMPVDDTRLAFYIFVLSMDWSRPMLLGEIAETARRASPLGARPFLVYFVEGSISVPVAPAPTDGFLWVDVWESAVEPIPPAPALPTVTTNKWALPDTASGITIIQSGSTVEAGKAGAYPREKITFDNSCVYATTFWRHADNTFAGRVEIAPVNNSGYIGLYNTTNQALEVYWVNYATCSDSTATVVTVYDSQNNAYNAFKFTMSGTDYYYVLDGTQTDWTDDLAGIGYSLTPAVVLPTVSVTGDWGQSGNWLYANTYGTNVSVLSGNSVLIGTGGSASPTPVDYDTTKSYSVIRWSTYQSAQGSGHTEYSIINSNDKIYAKNVTSGDLYLYAVRVAVCSSNQAMVVTVYDSSNNAYNAFKYTASGTDYYYVLDGTQTDWTNDLASIGYHLPVVLPTVNREAGAVAIYPNHANFNTNNLQVGRVWDWGTSAWVPSTYDVTKTYAAVTWHCENDFDGYYGVEISKLNNSIGIKNVLPFVMNKYIESVYATCDSLDVSIVKVYNTNNSEYNAFVYSENGANYYYVLDYVQNDWTNDLSTLGYSLTPNITNTLLLAVSLDANNEPEADTFEEAGWYWWSRVPDVDTKNALDAEGLWYNSTYVFGSAKYSSGGKTLVLTGVFTDAAGTSLAPGWNKAFELRNNGGVATLYTPWFGYSLAVKTYRVRIVTS